MFSLRCDTIRRSVTSARHEETGLWRIAWLDQIGYAVLRSKEYEMKWAVMVVAILAMIIAAAVIFVIFK